ncbi:MAG: AAA family ATPase, partial [Myxococcota bacterium]
MLDLTDADNPYQGLRPFSEANAPRFFGRESLIQELLSQLGETGDLARFLAVIGPSGSGKSSVVRAGLVPALRTGGLPGSEQWFIVDLQPGSQPIAALAEALRRVAPAGVETEDLTALLGADNQGLLRAARLVLPADPASELLLVIDQFEELFTLTADEGVRTHLLDSLVAAVLDERSRLRVVVTLRADMLDRPLRYVDVGELFHQRAALVRPLTPDELEQAIIGPARRAGLTLEEGLEATLLEAVTAQPGALPLLQHALSELFLRRQGRLLTLAAYHTIGGVAGALAQSAETIYAGLDAPGQAMARQMLLRLTTPGEGSDDTRRRVRRSEVLLRGSGAEQALAAFGTGRLLTFDHDPATREPTVEVAHEALLRAWPRLRGWLEAGRADLLVQRRLAAAAHEWHQMQRDPSFLATGARLTQFAALTTATDLTLNDEETTYIHDSLAAHDQQVSAESARQERELTLQKRAASRLRYLVGALVIFLVVALGLSAFAFNRQAAADANAAQAAANLTRSEAQRLAAEANLIFQRGGDPERATLLSIRAIQAADTPQANAALALATHATFARRDLLGHTGGVTSVAFAPDGRTMLTGSADKTARLWDVQSGQTIQTFVGHADGVTSVAFAPDGRTMLTGSADKTARLWDVQSGQTIQTFVGHADGVTSVTFAPDGRTMLTGSADKTARLWDVQSGQTIQTFIGHTDGIMSVALSPDGTQVLTGSGKLLPGSNDKTARLWDSKTGRQLQIFTGHTDGIVHVAFAPDGRRVVTSSNDKTARLWDTQTGQQVSQFDQTDAVWVAAFAADGRTILTGGDDKTARIWDVQTGKERQRAVQSGNVHAGTFAPDGRSFMIGSTDGSVRIVDVPPPTDTRLLRGHTNWVSGVRFAPDGRTLASISFDTTARLWDAQTGQELRQFVGHTDLSFGAIAFSPDGRMLATGSQDKTIRLWDVQTGQELRRITGHTDGVTQVAFSPDGQHLASSSLDKTARVWDVQTGRELLVLRGHSDGLLGVAFAPDGKTIATGSIDTTARLWDATTGALRQTLTGHTDVVNIAFSPDGEVLATASWDTTTRLWDAHTGALLHILKGHTDGVSIVAFSPDGRTVLTGSADRTARLWDRTTGAQLRVLAGHTDWVTDIAFTPDGRRIATASQDNSIRLWDTDVHDTIRWLCGRVQRDMSADERAQYGIADT